jgi:tetrapyrrole methylase family protein/MazG family protein
MSPARTEIVVVGLGPGAPDARTIGAQRALDRADRIVLRTRVHPGLDDLCGDPRVIDCDDLYENADDFDHLYQQIAERVIATAQCGGTIVFAVPGHPRFGERSVPLIEARALAAGIPLTVLDAVSFVDSVVNALWVDPLGTGLQIVDAEHLAASLDTEPFAAGSLGVDPARPLLVAQVYNAEIAAAVKIALSRLYPDDHPVSLVRGAGILPAGSEAITHMHLLDRQRVDHLTSLWIPPLSPLDATRSPDTLTRIVARLRRPDGCPWDRKQDHATLRDSILEEAFEVADAIDAEQPNELAEELGDLLLLIAMHAQIAEEEGTFRIEEVYEGITRKLIRRHPHVFANHVAETPDAVIVTWEGVKAAERADKGVSPLVDEPLARLPRSMPITRKMVEIMAPRTPLRGPAQATEGDEAMAAISALIEKGIDPERALEASLLTNLDRKGRRRMDAGTDGAAQAQRGP